jgi:tetratricopeptide (TPR) repeat protein
MAQPINLNELMEEMLKSRDGVGENSIVYQNGVKALKEGRNHDAINYFTEELDKIREKFGKGKFPLEPKLLRLIGNAHLNLNDPSEAGKSVQAAVQLYKTLKFSHDAELAECYCLKGQIYVMNKLYEKAAKKFDRQAKLLQKLKPCPTLETVRASLEAAKLYSITNQTSSADGHFSIALNLLYAKADKE